MPEQEYKVLRLKGTCPIAAGEAQHYGDYTKAKNNLVKKFADSGLQHSDFGTKKDDIKLLGESEDYRFFYNVTLKAEAADKIIASGNPLFVADVTDDPKRVIAEPKREYEELKVKDSDGQAYLFASLFGDATPAFINLAEAFKDAKLNDTDLDLNHDPIRPVGKPDAKGDFSYVIRVEKSVAEKIKQSGSPAFVADVTACPEKFPRRGF